LKKNLGKQTRLLGNISASTKTVGANPTPPVSEHARAPRPAFFLEASISSREPTCKPYQTRQAAAHERSVRNRKRENPPTKDPAAREAKTPTGSTCERGGAAAAALRSPPTLDSGGFLKESAGSAAGFRGASCSGGRDDGGVRGEEEGTGAGGRRPLRLLPFRPRRQEPQIG